MAIGSAPEAGVTFSVGVWSAEEMREWRAVVGSDLLGGYATLHYPSQSSIERINKEWEHADVHVSV